MDLLKSVFNFLFDTTISIWKKIGTIALIVILVWVIDGILGFSSFSFTNRKIETIKNISVLLKDTSLDANVKDKLKKELISVSNKKSTQDQILSLFPKNVHNDNSVNGVENKKITKQEPYKIIWLIISSCGLFLVVFLIIFIGLITSNSLSKKLFNNRETLKNIYISFGTLTAISLLFILVINFILPPLFGTLPGYRYLSNLVYQILLIGGFSWLSIRSNSTGS